ncbi:MAG: DNA repair and recombination protein RadB [archaeon]|nr:DNA repair and recombination protein RadB [archaeon]
MKHIPTGCDTLDNLLGGGFETGSITLLFGEGGAGKTNICLQTASNTAKKGLKTAYIDTEGLSPERIGQIFTGNDASNLLIFQARNFEEQSDCIQKVCKLSDISGKVGLIIVDSISIFYRFHYDDTSTRNMLTKQTETLLNIARRNDITVLITSQVYTNVGSGSIEFLGGHALQHNAKTIIRLDKKSNNKRVAVIIKHRSLPEGKLANYRIVSAGIESY